MEALEYHSTAALLDELSKRFDNMIFMGHRIKSMDNDIHMWVRRYCGCRFTCTGLCCSMQKLILMDQDKTSQTYEDMEDF